MRISVRTALILSYPPRFAVGGHAGATVAGSRCWPGRRRCGLAHPRSPAAPARTGLVGTQPGGPCCNRQMDSTAGPTARECPLAGSAGQHPCPSPTPNEAGPLESIGATPHPGPGHQWQSQSSNAATSLNVLIGMHGATCRRQATVHPLTHCGVVTACSSTATDGSRRSCRSTTPRSIQLKVKFGIRIVGAGSRGDTGTVNSNRSGRDASNRTCSASGRLATTVSAYLSSCAGFRAGSSVTRGPCRTCSPARDPGGCRAPRPTGAGPRSGRRTGGRQGPAGGSTAMPSRGRHTPELLEPGCLGYAGAVACLGQHHDGPGHLGVPRLAMCRRACTAQPISTRSVWTEPGPSVGISRVTGRSNGRPPTSGPAGRKCAWLTTLASLEGMVIGLA